ncbi:putative P-loop containing nucleoside triphosphate hydrolase, leucine-rich repeat domain, L [Medicago truncatula]|uniref:Putative P-loop containing nucleoside triphosphate hydrolase, leucine-rich repeat domain, L n=1 Tax=Medicago truncatula TaxID=3880 RepID=A0A396IP47_MEDTR|nr:putative P-loop containing nucleoside triphosphate hydrolase, leucine-rich repeat domain, L [Medicago truncatula]
MAALRKVSVLLEKLDSGEFVDNFRSMKLDFSVLKKLKKSLLRVPNVLDDDEEKQIINSIVIELLDGLRFAVYEVHNFVDEINTEALRCKVETPASKVLKYLSSPFNPFNEAINCKLLKLTQRLERLTSSNVLRGTRRSSPLVDESSIYGRDSDKEKLKHLLLSSDCDDSQIRIISIVGIEGIGKTTFAELLYNDPEVNDKFEFKLWEYISTDFGILKFCETILEYITSQTISCDNMKPIFLLVLDGALGVCSVDWILLTDILHAGKKGSRIIITTRDERVPKSMQTFFYVHYLKPLESEDCWSLVARHAFGACNDKQRSNLEEIGREIAKKCYGIPLAAVSIAAFLRIELSPYYWNNVLMRDIWESIGYDVQPALQLNYHYLSPPLKRCFAYCSIFPKNSILEKNVIVQLWIAEGLVESSIDQEKVGKEYFDILVSWSLIHRRSIGEENFEMQNLIHDLATMVSSSYCIRLDEHNLHKGVHNLSYTRGIYDSHDKFDMLYRLKGLRTFLALPLQEQSPLCLLSNKTVHDLLPEMKQLRVLSLSNYKSITEVPKSIGNLLYLRRLVELPEDIGELVNLQCLDISDTALGEMPAQIAKLENLHTLSNFVVSKRNGGLMVAELGKFPHLHGKLSISQLQNVNDPSEAFQANLKMKEQIDKLALEWECGSTFSDSQVQRAVLENLRPSTNLKSLTIKGYGGYSIPNWLGDFLFGNMVYLRISNFDKCIWLPPLGQLGNLKELIIDSMLSIKSVGTEFYGSDSSPSFQPFPSLETLHFEDMPEWEEWNFIGGTTTNFPSLKSLLLSKCPKLRGDIPDNLPSLTELELRGYPFSVESRHLDDNSNFIMIIPFSHVISQLMLPLYSLRQFTIDDFPFLTSFPTDGLPKTLKFLKISNCENLEFLPREYFHSYTFLEELKISYSCNSMISFTLGALPVLKSLFIEGCKNLKSIVLAERASEKSLSFLRSIKIWDCNELESFPPGGLLAPNLVYIAVWKCGKLRSLPERMNALTGLLEMEIDNLPNLQSFVIDDFPISLQKLTVGYVGGIMWNTEQTWEHLTCLSVLRINGNDMVNTLMGPLLPKSLETLCICGLNDKSIDEKWFEHLTSLQNLEIVNAPKLKSLPKKGLPSWLSVINMTCCPLLKAKLQRKRGKEWRKIAHIPSIIIDDELIT